MKKLIFMVALFLALAVSAFASGDLLVDDADLLTRQEEARLEDKLEQVRDQYGMDVVIVTVDSTNDSYIRDYADDYYDYNGYADDGVLLLVDMGSRQWWITGTGTGVDIFDSSVIDSIGYEFEDALSEGEYAEAFEIYIEECAYYIEDPFEAGPTILVAVIIGLLAALIATGIMRAQLKSVRAKAAASDYMKPGSMVVSQARELYLYSNVSRIRRQQNSSGGTHRSSSGRSHSGGGGRF